MTWREIEKISYCFFCWYHFTDEKWGYSSHRTEECPTRTGCDEALGECDEYGPRLESLRHLGHLQHQRVIETGRIRKYNVTVSRPVEVKNGALTLCLRKSQDSQSMQHKSFTKQCWDRTSLCDFRCRNPHHTHTHYCRHQYSGCNPHHTHTHYCRHQYSGSTTTIQNKLTLSKGWETEDNTYRIHWGVLALPRAKDVSVVAVIPSGRSVISIIIRVTAEWLKRGPSIMSQS